MVFIQEQIMAYSWRKRMKEVDGWNHPGNSTFIHLLVGYVVINIENSTVILKLTLFNLYIMIIQDMVEYKSKIRLLKVYTMDGAVKTVQVNFFYFLHCFRLFKMILASSFTCHKDNIS